MEARLASLNLSHYAAALQKHEIDDDILKLMTVADLREAGLDAAAAQRLHADLSGLAAPPGLAPPPGFSAPSPRALAALGAAPLADAPDTFACRRCAAVGSSPASRRSATVISFNMSSSISWACSVAV